MTNEKMDSGRTKAAVYARAARASYQHIHRQIVAAQQLAAELGADLGESNTFVDDGVSGLRRDRPGLQALLAAAWSRSFEILIVEDASRLGRDNAVVFDVLGCLRIHGVEVVSVTGESPQTLWEALQGARARFKQSIGNQNR